MLCVDGGRDLSSNISVGQGMPRNTKDCRQPPKARRKAWDRLAEDGNLLDFFSLLLIK